MDRNRFDTLSRALAGRTNRRGALRTGSGVLAAILAGSGLRQQTALAAPPEPPAPEPPDTWIEWPFCSEERPHYCTEAYVVGGVDRIANPDPGMRLIVYGSINNPDQNEVNRIEWQINSETGQALDEAMLDQEVQITIRTGRLKPTFGASWGRKFFVALDGNNEAGWTLAITGHPALQQITGHGDQERASFARVMCSGMYNDLTSNDGHYPDGMFLTTNAMSATTPTWANGAWTVSLWSPHHAAPDTSPDDLTHAAYSAWMSPASIAKMGLSTAEALAGQLAVTRTDEGGTTPVDATIEEVDGGVYIDIPDMTFSSPTLRFANAKKDGGKGKNKKGKKGKKKKGKKKKRK